MRGAALERQEGRRRVALVLPGGAARGAYEVGVVRYLLDEVSSALGRPFPIDLLCGTSVGAINVSVLAAFADEPVRRAARLEQMWRELSVRRILRPDAFRVLAMVCGLVRCPQLPFRRPIPPGGLLDVAEFAGMLRAQVPFERIQGHLRRGLLQAVTISTTRVADGYTVVFVEEATPRALKWRHEPAITAQSTHLGVEHALASAAIPFLFPAVRIAGELYCEGGLRQNVPLVPALRLGADALIISSPHQMEPAERDELQIEDAVADPLFLFGKTLNALLLDRIDNDIDRLEQINRILNAGCGRAGPRFLNDLNCDLGNSLHDLELRPIESVVIRASCSLGKVAAEFVRSPAFAHRSRGIVNRVLHRLADGEGTAEADLLSYLLFDGEFAGRLIEIGRADARAHHEDLLRMAGVVCESKSSPPG